MKRLRLLTFVPLAAIVALNLARPSPAAVLDQPTPVQTAAASDLSVMTYNIKGLPFPAAYGRADEVRQIGERLNELRRAGTQPHIVLLQEAFIPQAKAIARAAGYAHFALGPEASDAAALPAGGSAEQTSWLNGEDIGKWADSGLVILSDYPIIRTRKMAFPADMCAGYDCLAAKGVLVAWVKVPGQARTIAIADTHLNSRKASGVNVERANAAYLRQVAATREFMRAIVGSDSDVIFGGDFNVGHDRGRIAAQSSGGGLLAGSMEATAVDRITPGFPQNARAVAAVRRHAKDKQYFRAGSGQHLALRDLRVPSGFRDRSGASLSDHLPYIADYILR
ncbi:endonuclease/exonuclease/phosphatase family protein [Novosphingobium sp. BL-52-GroH]|uniref:endonuclease/exonuclease/phosphatase family protein n=1 Tax=Novosphingobium sp. BL-52-GroH TaxID=3349877 RepID=UPI00384F098A